MLRRKQVVTWISLIMLTFSGLSWSKEYRMAPVAGTLSSPFGWRIDPMGGHQRFHGGIDIAAPQGAPVMAVKHGQVVFSDWYGGYGKLIALLHDDGTLTLYGHASALLRDVGQWVQTGEVIAKVGSTGRSTGPHLHFEVRQNGQYVEPLGFLAALEAGPTQATWVPQVPLPPSHHRQVELVQGTHRETLHFTHD